MVAVALRPGLASQEQENCNVAAHHHVVVVSLVTDCLSGQAQTNSKPGLTGALNGVQLYTTEQSGVKIVSQTDRWFFVFYPARTRTWTKLIPVIRVIR